ncbi:MAG: hypothetical protein O7B23_13330 [Deltaproteobacteria bacterium]|nr:hypothetical protein [Deltaproteobacteria bacterium]
MKGVLVLEDEIGAGGEVSQALVLLGGEEDGRPPGLVEPPQRPPGGFEGLRAAEAHRVWDAVGENLGDAAGA